MPWADSSRLRTLLSVVFGASALWARPAPAGEPPAVLVSRQLLEAERLSVGDVVSLSAHPSGQGARRFRVVAAYEPTPDPARLGAAQLEARLHLSDLLELTGDPADPQAAESVSAINVRLLDAGDAAAFSRDLSARLPGLVVRSTGAATGADPFVVLERFHLAIAIVTVVASSIFLLALMVMLVDERRETVAVLRLIGFRRARILLQVLGEGLLLAVAGAVFGVLLAILLQNGFNRFFQWHYDTALVFVRITPRITWRSVLIAVPLGVLATLVSSWALVRRRAVALPRR